MTTKTPVPENMVKPFDEARIQKWRKGVTEHRNGDASAPFKGNILEEIADELFDLANYFEEDERVNGDTNWSIQKSFCRSTASAVRAVYFRRLGL